MLRVTSINLWSCLQCGRWHVDTHSFRLHVCKDISPVFSSLTLPFLLSSFASSLLYLPSSFLLTIKTKIPLSFCSTPVSSATLLCSSLHPCLHFLLSIPQSRIPGTVIPLCAAQCERIFNTTRTPGEETGKETDLCAHIEIHNADVWYIVMTEHKRQTSPTKRAPVSDTRFL